MKDLAMLDVIERYIRGEMLPEERVYFENLRKTNPAVDEAVVEHTLFLHQLAQYGDTKNFKSQLNDIHNDLIATGEIRELPPVKVINLWLKYKRTIMVAASIAGITALVISGLVSALTPKVNDKLDFLSTRLNATEKQINQVSKDVHKNLSTRPDVADEQPFTNGGTGFLVDPKGYIVTNAHIVRNATRVAVQNDQGEFKVHIIHVDLQSDLAFLKIDDTAFKSPGAVPYGISKTESQLGEDLFTLGYPRPDAIVYNKGYMSSRTGFQGDTLDFQIAIPANHGNSGTPVLNKDGEVVGIVRANQSNAQVTAFAIRSKNIFHSLDAIKADSSLIKNDSTLSHVHLPQSSSIKGLDRQQQIARIQNYIFIVKAN